MKFIAEMFWKRKRSKFLLWTQWLNKLKQKHALYSRGSVSVRTLFSLLTHNNPWPPFFPMWTVQSGNQNIHGTGFRSGCTGPWLSRTKRTACVRGCQPGHGCQFLGSSNSLNYQDLHHRPWRRSEDPREVLIQTCKHWEKLKCNQVLLKWEGAKRATPTWPGSHQRETQNSWGKQRVLSEVFKMRLSLIYSSLCQKPVVKMAQPVILKMWN